MTGSFSKFLIGAVGVIGAQSTTPTPQITSWVGSDIFNEWHACKPLAKADYIAGTLNADSRATLLAFAECNIKCQGSTTVQDYFDDNYQKYTSYPYCSSRNCKTLFNDPCYLNAKRVSVMQGYAEPNLQELVDAVKSDFKDLTAYAIHSVLDASVTTISNVDTPNSPVIVAAEAAYSKLRISLTNLQNGVIKRAGLLVKAEKFLATYTKPDVKAIQKVICQDTEVKAKSEDTLHQAAQELADTLKVIKGKDLKGKDVTEEVKKFQDDCSSVKYYELPDNPSNNQVKVTFAKDPHQRLCTTAVAQYHENCGQAFSDLIKASATAVRNNQALPPSVQLGKTLSTRRVEALKQMASDAAAATQLKDAQDKIATLVIDRLNAIPREKPSALGQNQVASGSGITTMGTAIMITVLVVLVLAVLIVALLAVRQYRSGPSSAV